MTNGFPVSQETGSAALESINETPRRADHDHDGSGGLRQTGDHHVTSANVEAGGLDCVSGTLQRIGYMITAGDRALGFVRAERTRMRASFPSGPLGTDVLVVNYITADAGDDESDDTIQVKASRTTKEQYKGGATSDAISDAERLLDQCGQI